MFTDDLESEDELQRSVHKLSKKFEHNVEISKVIAFK